MEEFEEFVEESLKEIEESLKKIMSSLQRQDKVISSMMGSYSNLHLKTLHQEPITLLQEPPSLPSHQETIIIQEAPSLPTHQETIILQEQLSLPTSNQTLKINPKNQSILPNPSPIIYKTFKKFTFLDITTISWTLQETTLTIDMLLLPLDKCAWLLKETKFLPLQTSFDIRSYRHSYLQQDEIKEDDQELMASALVHASESSKGFWIFNLEDKVCSKEEGADMCIIFSTAKFVDFEE